MIRYLVYSCLLAASASASFAQNLLENPGFDTGLGGWQQNLVSNAPDVAWKAEDADGELSSGSASLVSTAPGTFGPWGLSQCVEVEGGQRLSAGMDLREPGGLRAVLSAGILVVKVFDGAECAGDELEEFQVFTHEDRRSWIRLSSSYDLSTEARSARVDLLVANQGDGSGGATHEALFDNLYLGPAADRSCIPDATSLCLNAGRFRVTADWRRPDGGEGLGQAVVLTDDTGYFWFFNSANVEMVVKVLDGCHNNNRYWVFAGGLTNVEVKLSVEDTTTGAREEYLNPQGSPLQPIQDTQAFAACP